LEKRKKMTDKITEEELNIIKNAQLQIKTLKDQLDRASLFAENCLLKIYNKYKLDVSLDSILDNGEISKPERVNALSDCPTKYHSFDIGDKVNVCSKSGEIIISGATICEMEWKNNCRWWYKLSNYNLWYNEHELKIYVDPVDSTNEKKEPKFKIGDDVIIKENAIPGKIINIYTKSSDKDIRNYYYIKDKLGNIIYDLVESDFYLKAIYEENKEKQSKFKVGDKVLARESNELESGEYSRPGEIISLNYSDSTKSFWYNIKTNSIGIILRNETEIIFDD
jgi:hypothetical protein